MSRDSTKIVVFDHPIFFWRFLSPRNAREYTHDLILPGKQSSWATFLPILLSDFRVELRKTHNLCSRVRKFRSRSSKVVDFGINWKRLYDFLLMINSNLIHISRCFWESTYWLKIAKNSLFSSHLTSSSGVTPFEFLKPLYESWNLSPLRSRQWRLRDPSKRRFETIQQRDILTQRKIDTSAIAKTRHVHCKLWWRPAKLVQFSTKFARSRHTLSRVLKGRLRLPQIHYT